MSCTLKAIVGFLRIISDFPFCKHVLTGISQGSILGPLLLIIFLSDITDVDNSRKIIKYADETVICVADKDIELIK